MAGAHASSFNVHRITAHTSNVSVTFNEFESNRCREPWRYQAPDTLFRVVQ